MWRACRRLRARAGAAQAHTPLRPLLCGASRALSVPSATIEVPKILRIGAGSSAELPDVLTSLGLSRPLLVTDAFMSQTGLMRPAQDALAAAGMTNTTFDGAIPDPTTESLAPALQMLSELEVDCVVGFGGGSAMDTAKVLAVLAEHPGPLRQYKVPAAPPVGLPIVAIPTTAGTGSEVTKVAIVIDSETNEKMLLLGSSLLPTASLVDYELTMAKPFRLTADSGLDALCHALEAYVSRKANPFTDAMALAALSSITSHLRTACAEPEDTEARAALMLAATQAGIAFSNASVTLIHGMSRPIGAHFHVPHGLSNAMLLPSVTEFSIPGAAGRYAEAAKAMGFDALSVGAGGVSAAGSANAGLMEGLHRLTSDLRVPSPAEFGIDRGDFVGVAETMAEQALASGSPANNPLVPSTAEVVRLYEGLYA